MEVFTVSALLCLLWTPASAQGELRAPTVEPSCPVAFGRSAQPTCFCADTRDAVWSVTCGCNSFPPNTDVVLTPRLLPPDRLSSLSLTIRSCRQHRVRISLPFQYGLADFTDVSLDIRDVGTFLWDSTTGTTDLPPPTHEPLSIVSAKFKNVQLPQLPTDFFSFRLGVDVEFDGADIGEIPGKAFENELTSPQIKIRRSRIGRIAEDAFLLPQGINGIESNQTQFHIADSAINQWESRGVTRGVSISVLNSTINDMGSEAVVGTTGLQRFQWINNVVNNAEPQTFKFETDKAVIHFINNTFHVTASANPRQNIPASVIIFATQTAGNNFLFTHNSISNSIAIPVLADLEPSQVVGTRVTCDGNSCDALSWLPGTAFELQTVCMPTPSGTTGPPPLAAAFLSQRCPRGVARSADNAAGMGADVGSTQASEGDGTRAEMDSAAIRPTHVLPLVAGYTTIRTVLRCVFS